MRTRKIFRNKIITFLFLFLFAASIMFQYNVNGIRTAQEFQDLQIASENHEYQNASDGSKNSTKFTLFDHKHDDNNSINTFGLLFLFAVTFRIICTISANEFYIFNHKYNPRNAISLISQKIRQNN